MKVNCLFFILLFTQGLLWAQTTIQLPDQPNSGPGGSAYVLDSVVMEDFAKFQDGYWLFRPENITVAHRSLIVFNHGYGAFNPMIYGAWIKHLVRHGNIVVFPRYQKNLVSPKPKHFTKNAAVGIVSAIKHLRQKGWLIKEDFHLSIVAHSYGGVVSVGLANDYKGYGIPKPQVIMICSPGSGPFKGGLLESYENIEADTKLLTIISVNDRTVGEKFGRHVFSTSPQIKHSNLLRQFPDQNGDARITAGHNECYGIDEQFDTGLYNRSTRRAMRIEKLDPMDYNGYWKLFDALRSCDQNGTNCNLALGGTSEQASLGNWSDGKKIRPFKVYTKVSDLEK